MPSETFHYDETKAIFHEIESASQRSGVSRGQAFEDFLHMSVCALAGERMEEEYLQTVSRHSNGEMGKRGCDHIAKAFALLVEIMEKTRHDILGDLFERAISHGEHGLFLTPEPLCEAMARMTLDDSEGEHERSGRMTICDPCCGSGRMLMAVGRLRPLSELVGQDVDLRCVRITTLNLALWGRYAHVVWGNTLTLEQKLIYRTGFDGIGFVRLIDPKTCSPLLSKLENVKPSDESNTVPNEDEESPSQTASNKSSVPRKQLVLFE